MGRKRVPDLAASQGIPSSLYWGLDPGAFQFHPADPTRTDEHLLSRHRWAAEVRAAGYTVTSIREAAETDRGYRTYRHRLERRARLLADESHTA
jgi:hypothetical protein